MLVLVRAVVDEKSFLYNVFFKLVRISVLAGKDFLIVE